jgi:hypothetical protein
MTRTLKCSTVFVSCGRELEVYRSVEEVPAEVRRRFLMTANGLQSATILIADRKGRQELLRAAQGDSDRIQVRAFTPVAERSDGDRWRSVRPWVESAIFCAFAAAMWALFAMR